MQHPASDLVDISKLNGDFKRNYGKLLGAFLYLRSINAARGRSCVYNGSLLAILSIGAAWLKRHGLWLLPCE
jgi:hypothetical protein